MTVKTAAVPTEDGAIGDTFVRISGQGFPLVFVHGFTTTSEFWKEQVQEFSKSYRIVRINLPGHGASPAPASRGYRIEDFVEDVARVFQELSVDRAVLIGLSMGSPEFVARAAIRSISKADTRDSLVQIKVPALVIAGDEDRVTPPRESEILAKGISNSTLSMTPGAGHFSMLERPTLSTAF
jgi:pimeloyl-ACP methyl ester carboxylesterase